MEAGLTGGSISGCYSCGIVSENSNPGVNEQGFTSIVLSGSTTSDNSRRCMASLFMPQTKRSRNISLSVLALKLHF